MIALLRDPLRVQPPTSAPPAPAGLIQEADMTWVGGISTGQHNDGYQRAGWGVRSCAFIAGGVGGHAEDGLIISSHATETQTESGSGIYTMKMCRVSLAGVTPKTTGTLNECAKVQGWLDPTNTNHAVATKGRWTEANRGQPPGFNSSQWGGNLVYLDGGGNPRLWGSVSNGYSSSFPLTCLNVFTRPANLTTTGDVVLGVPVIMDIDGVTPLLGSGIDPNPRWVQWGMEIPDASWRTALGGTHLFGGSPFSIVSSLPWGVGLYVGSPADITEGADWPLTALLYYTQFKTMNGWGASNLPPGKDDALKASAGTHLHGDRYNGTTKICGGVWPKGSDSILIFGHHAYGDVEYSGTYTSTDWRNQVWAYDANDLLAVKNGTMNPQDVEPYAQWRPSTFGGEGQNTLEFEGATIDQTTGLIYVRKHVDTSGFAFDPDRRVHIYQVPVS